MRFLSYLVQAVGSFYQDPRDDLLAAILRSFREAILVARENGLIR